MYQLIITKVGQQADGAYYHDQFVEIVESENIIAVVDEIIEEYINDEIFKGMITTSCMTRLTQEDLDNPENNGYFKLTHIFKKDGEIEWAMVCYDIYALVEESDLDVEIEEESEETPVC